MTQVTIRRCPVCSTIGNQADQVERELKRETGLNVEVIDGNQGEFTIEVDWKTVCSNENGELPEVDQVVDQVKRKTHAGATA